MKAKTIRSCLAHQPKQDVINVMEIELLLMTLDTPQQILIRPPGLVMYILMTMLATVLSAIHAIVFQLLKLEGQKLVQAATLVPITQTLKFMKPANTARSIIQMVRIGSGIALPENGSLVIIRRRRA